MEGFDEAKMKQLQLLKEKMKLAKLQKQEEVQKSEEGGLNETKKDVGDAKISRSFDVKDSRFNKSLNKKFDGFFSTKKIGYPKGGRHPFQPSKGVGFIPKKVATPKPVSEVDLFDTPLTFEEVMRRKHERKKLESQKENTETENKNVDAIHMKHDNPSDDKQYNTGDGKIENDAYANDKENTHKTFSSENLHNGTFELSLTDNLPSSMKGMPYFSLREMPKGDENLIEEKVLNNTFHALHDTKTKQVELHVENTDPLCSANNTSSIYHEVLISDSAGTQEPATTQMNNTYIVNNDATMNNKYNIYINPANASNAGTKNDTLNCSKIKCGKEEVVRKPETWNEHKPMQNKDVQPVEVKENENTFNTYPMWTQNNIFPLKNGNMNTSNALHKDQKNEKGPTYINTAFSNFAGNTVKENNTNSNTQTGTANDALVRPNASTTFNSVNDYRTNQVPISIFEKNVIERNNNTLGNSPEYNIKQNLDDAKNRTEGNIFVSAANILKTNHTIFGKNINMHNGNETNKSIFQNTNQQTNVKNVLRNTNISSINNNNNSTNTLLPSFANDPKNKPHLQDSFFMMPRNNVETEKVNSNKNNGYPYNNVSSIYNTNNIITNNTSDFIGGLPNGGSPVNINTTKFANSSYSSAIATVKNNSINKENNTLYHAGKNIGQEKQERETEAPMVEEFTNFKNSFAKTSQNANGNNQNVNSHKNANASTHNIPSIYASIGNQQSLNTKTVLNANSPNEETLTNGKLALKNKNEDNMGKEKDDECVARKQDALSAISTGLTNATAVSGNRGTDLVHIFSNNSNVISNSNTNTDNNTTPTDTNAGAMAKTVSEIYMPNETKIMHAPFKGKIPFDNGIHQAVPIADSVKLNGTPQAALGTVKPTQIKMADSRLLDEMKIISNGNAQLMEQPTKTNVLQISTTQGRQKETDHIHVLNEPTHLGKYADTLKKQVQHNPKEIDEHRTEDSVGCSMRSDFNMLYTQRNSTSREAQYIKESEAVESLSFKNNLLKNTIGDNHILLNTHSAINQNGLLKTDNVTNKRTVDTSTKMNNAAEIVTDPKKVETYIMPKENDMYRYTTNSSNTDLEKIKIKTDLLQAETDCNERTVRVNTEKDNGNTDTCVKSTTVTNVEDNKEMIKNTAEATSDNNFSHIQKNTVTSVNSQQYTLEQKPLINGADLKSSANDDDKQCRMQKHGDGGALYKDNQVGKENDNGKGRISTNSIETTVSFFEKDNTDNVQMKKMDVKKTIIKSNDLPVPVKENGNFSQKEQLTVYQKTENIDSALKKTKEQGLPTNELKNTIEQTKEQESASDIRETQLVVAGEQKIEKKEKIVEDRELENEKVKEQTQNEANDIYINSSDKIQSDIFKIFHKNGDDMLKLSVDHFENKEDFDKINQIYKNIGCINKNISYINKYIPTNIENVHNYINNNTNSLKSYDTLAEMNKMFLEKMKSGNNAKEMSAELKTMMQNMNKDLGKTETNQKDPMQQQQKRQQILSTNEECPNVQNVQNIQNAQVDKSGEGEMELLNEYAKHIGSSGESDSSENVPEHVKKILQKRKYFNGTSKMQKNENINENQRKQMKSHHLNEQSGCIKKMKPYVPPECRELFRNTFYTDNDQKNNIFTVGNVTNTNATTKECIYTTNSANDDAAVLRTNGSSHHITNEAVQNTKNRSAMLDMDDERIKKAAERKENVVVGCTSLTENAQADVVNIVPNSHLGSKIALAGMLHDNSGEKTTSSVKNDTERRLEQEIKGEADLVSKMYEHIKTDEHINAETMNSKIMNTVEAVDSNSTCKNELMKHKSEKVHFEGIDNEENEQKKEEKKKGKEGEGEETEQDAKVNEEETKKEKNKENAYMSVYNHVSAITNAKTLEDMAFSLAKYNHDSEKLLCNIITKHFDFSVEINSLNDLPFLFEKLP